MKLKNASVKHIKYVRAEKNPNLKNLAIFAAKI